MACEVVELKVCGMHFGVPTYEICLLSKYLLLITKELISYFGLQIFIIYYFKGKEFSKANGVLFL